MYRIMIVEDDAGIAEGIAEQAKLWELEPVIVREFVLIYALVYKITSGVYYSIVRRKS